MDEPNFIAASEPDELFLAELATVDLLAELARLTAREFQRRARLLGLTPAQARMLYHVGNAGTATQAWLAERLGISPVSVSEQVDKLSAAGILVRAPHESDRRSLVLRPTLAGWRAIKGVQQIGRVIEDVALARLTRGQRAILQECLVTIIDNFNTDLDFAAGEPERAAPLENGATK